MNALVALALFALVLALVALAFVTFALVAPALAHTLDLTNFAAPVRVWR